MDKIGLIFASVAFLFSAFGFVRPVCHDIDTQACALMEKTQPDICKDTSIAQYACPKYCGLCPLTCYHCGQPVNNVSECHTSVQCQKGEKCFISTLRSTADGHSEYSLKCASVEECDDRPQGNLFIGRRDMSYHCCDTDLCNGPTLTTTAAPATTTTTVPTTASMSNCMKDIVVLVEDARYDRTAHYMKTNVKNLLVSIIHDIDIDPTSANMFEIIRFDGTVHRLVAFNDYNSKTALLNMVNGVDLHHSTNSVNLHQFINFVQHEAFEAEHGDRPNVPNAIVVFVDHRADYTLSNFDLYRADFDRLSHDVIVVDIGSSGHSTMDVIATDRNHVLHVSGYDTLYTVKQQLMSLICS